MKEFLKQFFSFWSFEDCFFRIEKNRHYSNLELINILKNEKLTIIQGNLIVLYLLDDALNRIDELEKKADK